MQLGMGTATLLEMLSLQSERTHDQVQVRGMHAERFSAAGAQFIPQRGALVSACSAEVPFFARG